LTSQSLESSGIRDGKTDANNDEGDEGEESSQGASAHVSAFGHRVGTAGVARPEESDDDQVGQNCEHGSTIGISTNISDQRYDVHGEYNDQNQTDTGIARAANAILLLLGSSLFVIIASFEGVVNVERNLFDLSELNHVVEFDIA
jgi:hypothetical protein